MLTVGDLSPGDDKSIPPYYVTEVTEASPSEAGYIAVVVVEGEGGRGAREVV